MSDELCGPQAPWRADEGPYWSPAGGCDCSRLSDLLLLMGCNADETAEAADLPLPLRRVHAGEPLFHEGTPADAIHFVRAGIFKTYRTAEDGYEQVLGFGGRTEVLGYDAICTGRHPTGAVALEESSVFALRISDMFSLGQRVPALARVMTQAVSRALTLRGDLADLMAAVAAEVRLARFLVQLSLRMQTYGQSPRRFHLRMSRRDIASHLGVAHETVSRSFRTLVQVSLVSVSNREVEIIDMAALRAFARNTRRHGDDEDQPPSQHGDRCVDLGAARGLGRPVAAPGAEPNAGHGAAARGRRAPPHSTQPNLQPA